jgi:hypothetical protein
MARATIAEDFGVKASQILCVEQPGKFHLDMGMLFVGKGVVIVNDSTEEWEAAKRNESTSFNPAAKKITAQLGLRTQLEALAVKDLQEGGMKVVRQKLESGTSYNFFKGEFVTGKDGETYYLTNGGPSDQQEKFRLLMIKEWGVVKDVSFTSGKRRGRKSHRHWRRGLPHQGLTASAGSSDDSEGPRAPDRRSEVEDLSPGATLGSLMHSRR